MHEISGTYSTYDNVPTGKENIWYNLTYDAWKYLVHNLHTIIFYNRDKNTSFRNKPKSESVTEFRTESLHQSSSSRNNKKPESVTEFSLSPDINRPPPAITKNLNPWQNQAVSPYINRPPPAITKNLNPWQNQAVSPNINRSPPAINKKSESVTDSRTESLHQSYSSRNKPKSESVTE